MKAFGLARIGRDAEIRRTGSGDAVASLSLAFSYGRKGDDGKRATQWIDASLWGKRAEALAPYLLKGGLVSVTLDEVHIETYEGRSGEGYKLAGKVLDIELAGSGERPQTGYQTNRAPVKDCPQPAARPIKGGASGFDDMDDDIPFVSASMHCDMTTSKARKMARYNF